MSAYCCGTAVAQLVVKRIIVSALLIVVLCVDCSVFGTYELPPVR